MDLKELEEQISITLRQFYVSFKKNELKDAVIQFVIADFGLVVCCISRIDYTQIDTKMREQFKDWRIIYVTIDDNLSEKRYEILWALMRGGYMKWLRYKFPRQIKNTLLGPNSLGNRIIEERLRLWNNKPKYKFLIDDNRNALKNGVLLELTGDPSFFDYMPGED